MDGRNAGSAVIGFVNGKSVYKCISISSNFILHPYNRKKQCFLYKSHHSPLCFSHAYIFSDNHESDKSIEEEIRMENAKWKVHRRRKRKEELEWNEKDNRIVDETTTE